jgi:hypothetical protein
VPFGTGVQIPADFGRAHDRHEPWQSVAQQTPWAQMPEAHSFGIFSAHGSPFGFCPHDPSWQTFGGKHWSFPAQRCPHWLPLQTLGAQARATIRQPPSAHVPSDVWLAIGSQV